MISISPMEVIRRLEDLFPGLASYAELREREDDSLRMQIWSNLHPSQAYPGKENPREVDVLAIDHLLDYTRELGVPCSAHRLGDNPEFEALVPYITTLSCDELLVVDNNMACYRATLDEILDDKNTLLADGDTLFISVSSARLIAVHHSGWSFDLGAK